MNNAFLYTEPIYLHERTFGQWETNVYRIWLESDITSIKYILHLEM
jgi:hypothetical protein